MILTALFWLLIAGLIASLITLEILNQWPNHAMAPKAVRVLFPFVLVVAAVCLTAFVTMAVMYVLHSLGSYYYLGVWAWR